MTSPLDPADAGPAVPGAVLVGKYRVERVLGYGGMGMVVEARHLALDERVALKFLLPHLVQDAEWTERFQREARAAVKIKSEHVARVSDVGTLETGAPYIVMEFLEGSDLAHVIKNQGPLQVSDAIDFVLQGCEAIAEAHSYGIVHRDLKPANLFLTKRPDGSPLVKVLDFGISKVMQGGVDSLTKSSMSMGSVLYMSPEQLQQTRSVDARTDIYALGVALYELITGGVPFLAGSLPELHVAIFTGDPTPLRSVRPDVPEHLASIIARAYARDRAQRFQSIAELTCALAPYAPQRSQPAVDRIARMAGLDPPPVGRASNPPEAPPWQWQRSSSAPGAPLPEPGMVGSAPQDEAAWQRGSGPPGGAAQPSQPGPPQTTGWAGNRGVRGSTQQLPGGDDDDDQPIPFESSGQIIVPGYAGPVSARASAAFAASAMRHQSTGHPGKTMLIAFIALAVLAVAGVAAVVMLRNMRPPPPSEPAASAQATSVLVPAPPPPPPAPAPPPALSIPSATPDPSESSSPPPPDTAAPPAGKAPPSGAIPTTTPARPPASKPTTAPQTSAPGKPTNAPPEVIPVR